ARAAETGIWGETSSRDFAGVLDGIRAIGRGEWAEADKGLTAALAVPELGLIADVLLVARANARFYLKDYSGARADAEIVRRLLPDFDLACGLHGLVLYGLALKALERGEEARPLAEAAVAEFRKSIQAHPGCACCGNNFCMLLMLLADEIRADGADRRAVLRETVRTLEAVTAAEPGFPEAWFNLGQTRWALGEAEAERGSDAALLWEDSVAALRKAGSLDAKDWAAPASLGRFLECMGRFDEAADAYEAALAKGGAAHDPELKGFLARARDALEAPEWMRLLNRAAVWTMGKNFLAARSLYPRAFAEAERAGIYRMPDYRLYLANGHFVHACLCLGASAGFDGPEADPAPKPPEAERALREEGIRNLRKAAELEWKDFSAFESEKYLAGIAKDPEMQKLLKELAGGK
ncbi:MAG: hypothetical protein MUC63_05895, partial [Planctomycetes bacterium]|nr:hypothetical protein [Planctomycetota bacterium]